MPLNENSTHTKTFLRQRLTANSLMGAVRFAVVVALYLFIYPFLLRSLGPARFGLWALLCIPSQYLVLGDLGISNALIKLVAEFLPGQARDHLKRLTAAATIIFSVFGALSTIAAFFFRDAILVWLRISPELLSEARILLVGTTLVVWISLLATVHTSVLSGLQRMDWVHGIQIGSSVVNALGIFVVIKLHYGLIAILLCNAAAAVVIWMSAIYLGRSTVRIRWTMFPRTDWSSVRALFSFGALLYIAALSSLLMEPAVKVLLTRYGNLELVSHFELASRIPLQARMLFGYVTSPLLPAASLLMTDLDAIRRLFARAMKLLWFSAVPAFLVLAAFSMPLIHIWLGNDVSATAISMSLLAFGWLFNTMTIPAFLFVQAMNRPRYAMTCAVLQGSICVAGAYILIPHVGLYGAVVSEVVGLICAAIYVLLRFLALCPMSIAETLGFKSAQALTIPAVFGICVFGIAHLVPPTSLAGLIALVCLSLALYFALSFWGTDGRSVAAEFVRDFLPIKNELKTP